MVQNEWNHGIITGFPCIKILRKIININSMNKINKWLKINNTFFHHHHHLHLFCTKFCLYVQFVQDITFIEVVQKYMVSL